nr:RHS repeat-associated core domain-containing protein [uncultured Desulfobacter sp.]
MEQPEVDGQIPVTLMTYNARGQVLTKTDPEGRITRYTYDGTTGELLSVVTDDTGLALTTQFTYDNVGNIQTQTDPEGHTTTFAYNGLRLPEQETGPAPFSYVTTYDYDEQGRLTQTKRQTNDTTQPWQTQTVTYTPTGKKYIVTDPEGNQTTHAYDEADRLSQITNAESQTTTYVYDDAGRLYQVIDAKSQTARQITYTAGGLKETETDANGNTTQYTYDGFNRPDRTTYPDTSYESYAWDDAGNLTSRLTRAGQTISFTYDDLNRLASKILPGPETITYTYDLTGLQEGVTDSLGTISHTYDNALRLTGVTYPDGRALGYQYDGNSNRTRLTYPDNAYVTYTYDVLNRITDIKQAGTTLLAHYDYDALSRRTTLTYGNGTTTTYSYEIDNDLASLALTHATGTATYTFTTNNIGIRTQTDVDDYRFVYRQAGIVSTAYTPNNLNQYTAVGGLNPAYDGNGNLTSDGTNTYAYNAENRLVTAVTPDHTAAYVYDPMGRRIEKEVDSVTTRYLHDGNQVIVEYNSTGTELRRYIYGPGIDQPVCMITGSATYYYQFDGLGSVAALTDETGALQEIYAYNIFGQPNGTSYFGNPYLYTGREYDPETGLYYYRARYYNPTFGRFMQTDPIGYGDGMNLYAFVQNNPLVLIDPFGLCAQKGFWNDAKNIVWDNFKEAINPKTYLNQAVEVFYWPSEHPKEVITFLIMGELGALASNSVPQRLTQDINVNPTPPRILPTNRPIGTSLTQNAAAQAEIRQLQQAGYTDIRVNQQQVNAAGQRVGINRPDIQATSPSGERIYLEYDTSISNRGPLHQQRITANDPNAQVLLRTVD